MKQNKTLLLTCLLLLSMLIVKTSMAQTGATCSSALSLTISTGQSTGWKKSTNDTLWYTFNAPNKDCYFKALTKLGNKRYLRNIVYGVCGFMPDAHTFGSENDSTYYLRLMNLQPSQNYQIGLVFDLTGRCKTCNDSAAFKLDFLSTASTPTCAATCTQVSVCEYLCNGSFEQNSNVPLLSIPQHDGQLEFACDWYSVWNTPDLFHTSSPLQASVTPTIPVWGSVNIPTNFAGCENVRIAGQHNYAGFWSDNNGFREVIGAKLKTTLTANHTYSVTFYLSLGEESFANTDVIGFTFSNTPTFGNVTNPVYTPINTTTLSMNGWTQFGFSYTATGTENYFFIGALGNTYQVNYSAYSGSNTGVNACNNSYNFWANYYYVDDISVLDVATFALTPTLTAVCNGTAMLSVTPPGASSSYSWSSTPTTTSLSTVTGASITVSPTVTTIYTVSASGNGSCGNALTSTVTINPITVTSSYSFFCTGNSAPIVLTAGGLAMSSYTWISSPATSSLSTENGPVVSVSPTVTTTYTVFGNVAGCSETYSATISILNAVPIVALSSSVVCVGSPVVITTTNGYILTADFDQNSVTDDYLAPGTTTYSLSYTYTAAGTYSLQIVADNINSCQIVQDFVVVASTTIAPTVTVSPSQTICATKSATLTATGANTYTWIPVNLTTATVVVTPTATTVYTVTGVTACGSSIKNVTVTVVANPTVTASASPTAICTGTTTTLTASGATNYTWSPGTYTTAVITVSPSVSTIYTVTGSNGSGCSQTKTVAVNVTTNPAISCVPSNSAVCTGFTATLTASVIGATSYTWNPGALSGSVVAVSPTVNTVYTVSVSTPCGIKTSTVLISVVATPTVTASATSTLLCSSQSATLTASGATTYTWNPGGLTTASVVVTPSVTTTYTVIGSNGSCTNTKTLTITVNATPTISVSGSTVICSGATTTLTASGVFTYTWNPAVSSTSVAVVSPTVTTTYTITGKTKTGACIGTKIITVVVNQTPTLTVNAPVICAGATATLIANGANTYSWNTGATTNSIAVTPTVTTNYTVTGTMAGGCSSSVVATVVSTSSLIPAFSIITSSTSPVIASGTGTNVVNLSSTISNTTGLSFYWLPSTVFTPTTNFNLTQPEVISLTVSNDACGTSSTQSICVNYVATACAGTYSTLNNATLTSTATLGATTATYNVTGTLTINWTGSALEHKTFIMATGSKVEITATSNITFNNIMFFSCDGMWGGIEIKTDPSNFARVNISGDQNSIEDAYMGIYCLNPGGANLNPNITCELGALFNKNYYDVYLDNTKNASAAYTFNFNRSRMFSQNSNNSPGGNLKCSGYYNPPVKARSYAGLYATNAGIINFNYNASPIDYNQIKNKDYGLYFNNTNANVNNVNFSDTKGIQDNNLGGFPTLPRGVGVYSQNSNYLHVKPASTPTTGITTNFTNMGFGIITNNTYTVDVQNTSHTSTTQTLTSNPFTGIGVSGFGLNGVFITNAKDVLRVNNNTFSQTYYPVTANYTVAPNAAMIMSVAQNTITATGVGVIKEGVTVSSALSFTPTTDNMRVTVNTFSNVEIGVKTVSVKSGLRISNNNIYLNLSAGNSKRYGVYLAGNNNKVIVDNNYIFGSNTNANPANYGFNNVGIFCETSPTCNIQCNTIEKTGHGVEYRGGNASPGAGLLKNTFIYPMKRGLVLSNGGLVGMQGSPTGSVVGASANQWTGSWPTTYNNADPNQTYVGGPLSSVIPSNSNSSPLWVRNNATELPTDNAWASPSIPAYKYTFLTTTLTATASDYSTCPTGLTQGLKMANVTNGNSNEDRDEDFVNYIQNLLPAANTDVTPQDKFMLKQMMFDALTESGSTNPILVTFYNQQQNTAIDAYQTIDSLLASGNTTAANTNNAQASQTNDITQTQNTYNALYINGIQSSADMDNLIAIAELCPQQYGTAVYQARALLQSLTYVGKTYSDSCYNNKLNSRMGYGEEENSVSVADGVQAKLYPNPNNGNFKLAYDLKQYHTARIHIIDISGKLVHIEEIDDLNTIALIHTNNLQHGIYFIQLVNDDKLLWTDKLVIYK